MGLTIEIGGGAHCDPAAVNLDPVHGAGDWRRFAQCVPWPVATDAAETIRASHVMEHIPAGAPRIAVLNEAHRVLAPGGTLEVLVPLVPSWRAFADPTHVSHWCLQSFRYFDGTLGADADYGIRPWHTIDLEARGDELWEGRWLATPA